MHREISHTDPTFEPESPWPLYLFTALLAVLLGIDLAPRAAAALGWPELAPSPGEFFVFSFRVRFALIAALLGGARALYGSLQSLLDGRIGADLALAIACL